MTATALLLSTYEPSGDALAAVVIDQVLQQLPRSRMYALGGPKMEAAGAKLIEHTTQRGSMFLETLAQARSHRTRLVRMRSWLESHPIDALIAVDSPAGNWAICRLVRRLQPQARIIHLVAPQVWAWAPWRIRRLRKLTDHVLCLLPFEPSWFKRRGVRATFVSHPVFDPACRTSPTKTDELPRNDTHIALLPGSRVGEVTRNWPTMLACYLRLRADHPKLQGTVAALDDRIAELIDKMTRHTCADRGWPDDLKLVTARTEGVLDWCDIALVASGTVCLQVAARLKPMVIMYNMTWLSIIAMGWMVRTRTFTLPNLVSESAGLGRAVPELVPHFGQVKPVMQQLLKLFNGSREIERQRLALSRISEQFQQQRFTQEAPRQILATLAS